MNIIKVHYNEYLDLEYDFTNEIKQLIRNMKLPYIGTHTDNIELKKELCKNFEDVVNESLKMHTLRYFGDNVNFNNLKVLKENRSRILNEISEYEDNKETIKLAKSV